MPLDAFVPYRSRPGASAEAARVAAEAAAEPLLMDPRERAPAEVAGRSMALVPAGLAASPDEACLAADGTVAGGAGAARACPCSERLRRRVAVAAAGALAAGHLGLCLDRPDAALALGLLGAGFCAECQRAFFRELSREYGEQFAALDYRRLAQEALAQAAGALSFAQLPFGREFWRFRRDVLFRAVRDHARDARDAARSAGSALEVAARFEALGPAQIGAARHLDAAIFPVALPPHATGVGAFRLLRAAMGRRPCAAELPAGTQPEALLRLAGAGAACGVDLFGPEGEALMSLAPVRRFTRRLLSRRDAPTPSDPVMECAVLYSAECDLWTGGRHRQAVEEAGEALSALLVQAPVVLRVADASPSAALVLAGAGALAAQEVAAVARRLEAGGGVLALGEVGSVDAAGWPLPARLPDGKPVGVKVGKGTLVALPVLPPTPSKPGAGLALESASLEPVERALTVLLGRGRHAVSLVARAPVLAALCQQQEWLDVHLVSLSTEPVRGATLFLGSHVAGTAKRARFQSAEGADERIAMNPSGYSISTVLPAFRGYAVLSLQS
jgi:hypothetical protein